MVQCSMQLTHIQTHGSKDGDKQHTFKFCSVQLRTINAQFSLVQFILFRTIDET